MPSDPQGRAVSLCGGKAAGRVALVDDGDHELVMQYKWYVLERVRPSGTIQGPYALAFPWDGTRQVGIYMHKLITGWPLTDHINHNGLDNRRANLRPASTGQNLHNARARVGCASRFKGVDWDSRKRRWRAAITVDGKRRYLGRFVVEEDAARAYDVAAVALSGEFACLNLPELGPQGSVGALDASRLARGSETHR